MRLKQLKSAIHKKLNQSYIYDCNKEIDFKSFVNGSIIIANDTSIITLLALKKYLKDESITVLGSFDDRVKSLENAVIDAGINYIDDISFWNHQDILVVDKSYISQVEQNDNRFLLFVCGPEMPYFSDRKNLDRQVFFDIAKLKNLKSLNEEMDDLSVRAWEGYLTLLKAPAEIWFRQMLNAKKNLVLTDTTGVALDGYKFATGAVLMSKSFRKSLSKKTMLEFVCLLVLVGIWQYWL